MIELYLAGAITTEHLTTTRRPLAEANEALADLASGRVLRTVLEPATKGTPIAMSTTKSISGSAAPPVVTLSWSKEIGKRVREGSWTDQAISTTRKFEDALDAGQFELGGPACRLLHGRGKGRLRDLRRLGRGFP